MSNTTEPEDFEFSEEVNELAAEALAKIDSFANELESVDERISYLILTSTGIANRLLLFRSHVTAEGDDKDTIEKNSIEDVQRLMCDTVRIAAVNTFISNEEQKLEGEAAS